MYHSFNFNTLLLFDFPFLQLGLKSLFLFSSLTVFLNTAQFSSQGAGAHMASEVSLKYCLTPAVGPHTVLTAEAGIRFCEKNTIPLGPPKDVDPAFHISQAPAALTFPPMCFMCNWTVIFRFSFVFFQLTILLVAVLDDQHHQVDIVGFN